MKSNMSAFVALVLLATFINTSFCYAYSYVGCIHSEREALLKLKQDLHDPFNRLASWDIRDGDCCKWAGVVCNNFTGHVLQLNLGTFVPDLSIISFLIDRSEILTLGGKINPSLVDLKHLIHLDLSSNNFKGIQIPKFLGSLENLRYLNLSRAGFAGMIPHQLGNLSNLQYLDLSGSSPSLMIPHELGNPSNLQYLDLSGSSPSLSVESLSWLSNVSLLKHLDLSVVDLGGASDWLPAINSLPSLKILKLSHCKLPHIPPFSSANFSSLNALDLSSNGFDNSLFHRWVLSLSHLVFLNLSRNEFQGQIPNELGNMTSLRYLDLSYNQFNSTRHGLLSKLNDLEYLSLSTNNLQGTISSIGLENSTSIKTLDLSWNEELGGKISSSFVRLCKLRSMDVSSVKLNQDMSQVLDIFSECVAYALESLVLFNCQISGQLTNQLGLFKSLHTLILSHNSLSGPLPPAFGELSFLKDLDLSNNMLNGSIPLSLGQISHLESIDLSNNKLIGILSENFFVNLTKLTSFSTSGNSLILQVNPNWVPPFQLDTLQLRSCHLGPQFPSWLHYFKDLSYLDVSNTRISDTIPRWFWNSFFNYEYLNLSNNQIRGAIPDFDRPLTRAMSGVLDLSNNSLSGSIFHLICNKEIKLQRILFLKLSKNYFSGVVPDCWMNWPKLQVLHLGNNHFNGSLPITIGALTSLQSLNLRNNRLSGVIPMSFQNCSKLKALDLGENEFVGNIPPWIGERFSRLKILNLRSNKFRGVFPIQLCRLASLQILDVAYNSLSGTIPRCINNFTAMATTNSDGQKRVILYFSFSYNSHSANIVEDASVVTKGFKFEYSSILNLVRSMDISKNCLSGEIPTEVTNLEGLQSLNLSHNFFTGKIPKMIGNMRSIESLDFSTNQFSGNIPQSMSSLSFLNHLNLSDNNLTGKIPLSTQLQSLDASCFARNHLCGAPLPNCTEKNASAPEVPNGNENEDEVDWLLYVSMALGFVVGFWCFIGPILVNRRWRYKYCHFLDGFIVKFGCLVRKCF